MAFKFDATRVAYLDAAWDDLKIVRNGPEIERDARKILAKKAIYVQLQNETGVPWWFSAIVDMREGGIEHLGTRHLHNGDSLGNYTTHVPAGRPKVDHGPPFTWFESAVDSIRYQGLDQVKRWTIERALHLFETYNGGKYWGQDPPRPSPYVFSCCSIYDPPGGPGGKVLVDHGPIEDVVDPQYGCAAMLFALIKLDPTIRLVREGDNPLLDPVGTKPLPGATKAGTVVITAGTAGAAAAQAAGFSPAQVAFFAIGAVILGLLLFTIYRSWKG